jgi:glutamine cyclotransferase
MACKDANISNTTAKNEAKQEETSFQIVQPKYGQKFKEDDAIIFELKSDSLNKSFDSVQIFMDNKLIGYIAAGTNYTWKSKHESLGRKAIQYIAYSNGKKRVENLNIFIVDKKPPLSLSYRIVKVYPHSTNAYTQGLIYENGIFYESDGQYGMSTLRKVDIKTGKTIQQHILPNKYFAEGIAIVNDKIYQLTWRENTCFVYDKETLSQTGEFGYEMPEGWGLASNTKNLFFTDGSNKIYIVDPQNFSVLSSFEVVDDQGPVDNLNELEYVNGYLFANVYQTDFIVVISISEKRMVGKLNLAHLLQSDDYQSNTDVLNGIAYNPSTGHFYVTGKNWPKLFEIELTNWKQPR